MHHDICLVIDMSEHITNNARIVVSSEQWREEGTNYSCEAQELVKVKQREAIISGAVYGIMCINRVF